MICSMVARTCKGTLSVPLSVTTGKVPPSLIGAGTASPWVTQDFQLHVKKQVRFVCMRKPKLSEQDVNL